MKSKILGSGHNFIIVYKICEQIHYMCKNCNLRYVNWTMDDAIQLYCGNPDDPEYLYKKINCSDFILYSIL